MTPPLHHCAGRTWVRIHRNPARSVPCRGLVVDGRCTYCGENLPGERADSALRASIRLLPAPRLAELVRAALPACPRPVTPGQREWAAAVEALGLARAQAWLREVCREELGARERIEVAA